MIILLTLTSLLHCFVNTNDIFSDFARSICQQRYESDGSVVCQPDGEYAARQCPLSSVCYCSTETGEIIEGTRYNKDRNYICQNVLYNIQYKHENGSPGFDTGDLLMQENELIRSLLNQDRRDAIWEMQDIVITRLQREPEYSVYEATVAGYNTRLIEEDVFRHAKRALKAGTRATKYLELVKTYDSVHEGQCPAPVTDCKRDARVCFSDSECLQHESCCKTTCDFRCVSLLDGWEGITTPAVESSSPTTEQVPTTAEWYSTSGNRDRTSQTQAMTTFDWSNTERTEVTEELAVSTTKADLTEPAKVTSSTSGKPPPPTDPEVDEKTEYVIVFEPESSSSASDKILTTEEPGQELEFQSSTVTPPTERTEETVEPTSPEATSQYATQTSRETVTVQPGSSEMTFSESSATEKEEETSQPTEKSGSTEGSSEAIRYSEASYDTNKVSRDSTQSTRSATSGTMYDLNYWGTAGKTEGSSDTTKTSSDVTKSSSDVTKTDPITFFTDDVTPGRDRSDVYSQTLDIDFITTPGETSPPEPTDELNLGYTTSGSPQYSLCQQESSAAQSEGREGPECNTNGAYSPEQCEVIRGICWCVDAEGIEIKGTMRYGSANCEDARDFLTSEPKTTTVPMSDCWRAYQEAAREMVYNKAVVLPACDSNGLYQKSQCMGIWCWCVDEFTGMEINGTKKPGPIDCHTYINGVCPKYARDHNAGTCIDKCDADMNCYGTTKCCQTQCGRDCVYPQTPDQLKEGMCPAPASLNTVFERCVVDCSHDQKCGGAEKCCFNGCGYSCNSPIYDTNMYCKNVKGIYRGEIADPRDQYTEGDVITVSCNHGYELQGATEIRCLATGKWEHDLPVCKRISCGVPGSGQFVMMRGSDYWVGGVVEYQCYGGYELIGDSVTTCEVSGRWSHQPPICKRRECPDVNQIPHGRVYGNVMAYGNRIGFRCDYGYSLIGSEQRLCMSDGSWSGTESSCVRGYFNEFSNARMRRHHVAEAEQVQPEVDDCHYRAQETIDFEGKCVDHIWTVQCNCGESNTVQKTIKVLCQHGDQEYIEVNVEIGTDCSCCQH